MVSANTLCKNVLNVKNTVIENFNLYSDEDGVKHIRIFLIKKTNEGNGFG